MQMFSHFSVFFHVLTHYFPPPPASKLQITRNYDEEEQGYDSDKERKESDDSGMSPRSVDGRSNGRKHAKVNGGLHADDMDVSD